MTLVTLANLNAAGMTPPVGTSLRTCLRCPLGILITFMPGLTAVNGQPVTLVLVPATVPNSADPLMPGSFMTFVAKDTKRPSSPNQLVLPLVRLSIPPRRPLKPRCDTTMTRL